MSRADAYGAYYRESRARLLHQTYAFCGNTEVARHALADAFVSASHHWRKVSELADRDAWVRERAFRATGRAQNRASKPWYEGAMATADEHRALLGALTTLREPDRTLVIVHLLAGLDLPHAGREAGLTDAAATASYDGSMAALAAAGVDTDSAVLTAALGSLRRDLSDEPVDDANRLRREGNRRRRSHLLLAGITALALAIGAGALTATQTPATETDSGVLIPGTGVTTAPPPDPFSTKDLASVSTLKPLDGGHRWKIMLTTSDFGADQPVSACLAVGPSNKKALHYWVREFSSGKAADPTQASQSLEVDKSADMADASYNQMVQSAAACRGASRQLVDYSTVDGLGDSASMFTYRYVVGEQIRTEQLVVVRSGVVAMAWVVRPAGPDAIRTNALLTTVGNSIDTVCSAAGGHCSEPPFDAESLVPPPVSGAAGFLSTVDLPVFAGIAQPWVATPPKPAPGANPSATPCDQADFNGAGAQSVSARTYVIPEAPQLADIFGMSETTGTFGTSTAARSFVNDVVKNVAGCEKKQLNAKVKRTDDLADGVVRGRAWEIDFATSQKNTIVYRVALIRVGSSVAQLTFTPSENVDLTPAEFNALADRAGRRLQQG